MHLNRFHLPFAACFVQLVFSAACTTQQSGVEDLLITTVSEEAREFFTEGRTALEFGRDDTAR